MTLRLRKRRAFNSQIWRMSMDYKQKASEVWQGMNKNEKTRVLACTTWGRSPLRFWRGGTGSNPGWINRAKK